MFSLYKILAVLSLTTSCILATSAFNKGLTEKKDDEGKNYSIENKTEIIESLIKENKRNHEHLLIAKTAFKKYRMSLDHVEEDISSNQKAIKTQEQELLSAGQGIVQAFTEIEEKERKFINTHNDYSEKLLESEKNERIRSHYKNKKTILLTHKTSLEKTKNALQEKITANKQEIEKIKKKIAEIPPTETEQVIIFTAVPQFSLNQYQVFEELDAEIQKLTSASSETDTSLNTIPKSITTALKALKATKEEELKKSKQAVGALSEKIKTQDKQTKALFSLLFKFDKNIGNYPNIKEGYLAASKYKSAIEEKIKEVNKQLLDLGVTTNFEILIAEANYQKYKKMYETTAKTYKSSILSEKDFPIKEQAKVIWDIFKNYAVLVSVLKKIDLENKAKTQNESKEFKKEQLALEIEKELRALKKTLKKNKSSFT